MTTRGQSNQEHASLFHDNDIFPVEMNQSQNYQLNYRVKLFDLLRALERLTALFKTSGVHRNVQVYRENQFVPFFLPRSYVVM